MKKSLLQNVTYHGEVTVTVCNWVDFSSGNRQNCPDFSSALSLIGLTLVVEIDKIGLTLVH